MVWVCLNFHTTLLYLIDLLKTKNTIVCRLSVVLALVVNRAANIKGKDRHSEVTTSYRTI